MSATALAGPVFKPSNTVVFRGQVDGETVSKAMMDLAAVADPEIYLVLDSPGGSVIDGMQLVDFTQGLNKKIHCVASFAASQAFIFLQSHMCTTRTVLPNALIMQHVGTAGLPRQQQPNLNSMMGMLNRLTERVDVMQAKRIGISVKQFNAATRDDLWLWGDDAVKFGAADKSEAASCTKDLIDARVVQDVQVFIFTLRVTWSGCPLITAPLKVEMPNMVGAKDAKRALDSYVYYRQFTDPMKYRDAAVEYGW
jgi:ATP-dependent protease ClpP protease subunit